MKKFLLLILAVGFLAGCEFDSNTESITRHEEYDLKAKEFELEGRKIDAALRQQVMKACMDRGGIPTILNGNIDCKPFQK